MIYLAIFTLVIFAAIFLLLVAVRSLRWLSIIQQKEYRLDRLQSFLKSDQGTEEIRRVLPQLSDFSRTGLKRPKITARILLLALVYAGLLAVLLTLAILSWLHKPLTLAMVLIFIYLLIPMLVYLASLPTVFVARLQIFRLLKQATELNSRHQPRIIGVGGSYGKTSTKLILAELLGGEFTVFYTPKSFNNAASIAGSIVSSYQGEEIAIIEYGAYRQGEIESLTEWLPPEIAVITGLTEQHLSLFGSMDSSVLAESELVSALREGSQVFYNAADTGAKHIVTIGSQGKKLKKHAYGRQKLLSRPQLDQQGKLSFLYHGHRVQTNLVGKHYLANIEGAVMVAEKLDINQQKIAAKLQQFEPGDNFVHSYQHQRKFWVLNDGGTSNPMGFRAMVEIAAAIERPKKILLFPGIVDLGEKSEEIHHELAVLAGKVFDQVLYVGQDGQEQFALELGSKIVKNQAQIVEILQLLGKKDLLVLEGRMPALVEGNL